MSLELNTSDSTPSESDGNSFGGFDGFDARGVEESPFPIDCLPGAAGEMARQIVRVTTCHNAALAAASVLGTLSASLGGSLEVISGPDHRLRGNLFILAVGDSGTGKTENYKLAVQPLVALEAQTAEDWDCNEGPGIRASLTLVEQRIKAATRRLDRAIDPEALRELSAELRALEMEKADLCRSQARRPCLVVGDVTKEKLAPLMEGQPKEAIASMSSEARGIVAVVNGRYSTSSDIDFYCAGYSGENITIDRIKNEERIILRNPCLSIFWMVQPDVVTSLFATAAMTVSGFFPRFIAFDSKAVPQERSGTVEPIPDRTKEAWQHLVADLYAMRLSGESATVPVSPDADRLFLEFHNECIRRRRAGGDLTGLNEFVARWAENAWRIALVLHAATHGKLSAQEELSEGTADAAIRLMRWFANAQVELMDNSNRELRWDRAQKLVAMVSRGTGCRVTIRDLAKNHGFKEAEVNDLVRTFPESLLIKEVQPPGGGRPSKVVTLTPERQNPQ